MLSLLPLVGFVAACAGPMRWERPDTDAVTAEADRRECRAIAYNQAQRMAERPLFVPYTIHTRDRRGRTRDIPVVPFQQFGPPVWWPYAPSLAIDQITVKHDLFVACLEAKGYALVPVEEEGSPAS